MTEQYWCTGFEIGANAGYTEMVLTGATISTAQKRTGNNSLYCNAGSGANAYADNPNWGTPFVYASGDRGPATRFYCYLAAYPTQHRRIARWTDGSGNGYSLRLNANVGGFTAGTMSLLDNAGAVLATTTTPLPLSAWDCVQWTLRMKTTCKSEVWVNFVKEINVTPSVGYEVQNFRLGPYNSEASALAIYFDDAAIKTCSSGTLYPPVSGHVVTMVPNGFGATSEWTASFSANWECVDEIPANGDTDYVAASPFDPLYDAYALTNPVPAGRSVSGACPFGVARSDVVANYLAMGVISGVVSKYAPGYQPGLIYAMHSGFIDPSGLAAAAETLQATLVASYYGGIHETRVTQMMVNVDYQEELPGAPTALVPTGKVFVQKPTFAGDYSQGLAGVMGAVQVQVYASDGVSLVWDSGEVAASGARWLVLHGGSDLSLGTTYKWQARNKDVAGYWGPWCALQTLNINAAPTTPTGCDPTGGETVTSVTPTLVWVHNDPDSDGQKLAQYEIRDNDTGLLVTGYPETNGKAVDRFTRANSATALGNDETLPTPLAWAVAGAGTPTWGIIDGQAYCVVGTNASMAYVNAAAADGEIRCRVKREGTYGLGLVFRSDGTLSNYFRLHYLAPAAQGIRVRLTKVLATVESTVFTSADLDIADGGFAEFRVVLSGSSIAVYINGVNVYTGSVADLSANTRHGMYYPAASSPSVARWDDFVMYVAASAVQQHVVPGGRLSFNHTYAWKVKTSDGSVPGLWGAETAAQAFVCAQAPTASITNPPTDGSIVTAPALPVAWDYSDSGLSPQSKRRVVVYNDALTELVYDSGEQAGGVHWFQIPSGYLHNGLSYKVKVYVWNSLPTPLMGESSWRSFDTQWTPPAVITNVTAVADATGNPHVNLSWDISGLGADFVKYSVYRRAQGTTPWTRIVNIATKATVTHVDYNCPLATAYQYCVRQTQNVGGDEIESNDSNTPSATIAASGSTVIHDVVDPTSYVVLKWNPSQEFRPERQQAEALPWGRTAPVVEFGPALYRRANLSYALLASDAAKLAAINRLFADRHTLCYRDSRGERAFCNFGPELTTTYRYPGGWQETIPLLESDYVEAV